MKIRKKICLLGSYGVGKTSLIRRFVHNKFEEQYLSTIGVHVSKKTVNISNKKDDFEVELLIWDIANIKKFDLVVKKYLKGAHGAIIVVDISRPNTFEQILDFIAQFKELNKNSSITIVGNKIDLIERDISEIKEISKYEKELKKTIFLTSAKTGENVEKLFVNMAEQLI